MHMDIDKSPETDLDKCIREIETTNILGVATDIDKAILAIPEFRDIARKQTNMIEMILTIIEKQQKQIDILANEVIKLKNQNKKGSG